MTSWISAAALALVGLALARGAPAGDPAAAQNAPALQVGDRAPEFSLPGSDGKTYSLKEFRGKKAIVLAWFPKAFTGG
ncbi:MAG: redoxin domain-containing protein [Armatimonadetes bacterium]|nr:redoxin domain-containing protein [Armatimonadota bacterium]